MITRERERERMSDVQSYCFKDGEKRTINCLLNTRSMN